jgi:Glycerol-3-phosphate dehydrogenase
LGADILNYTNATIVSRQEDRWILELSKPAEPPVTRIDATAVLNMSGVWIDSVNRALEPSVKSRVTGTKGCHILVRLPPECANFGIATLNSKMEPFYCIPWRGYHYFGPTETLYEGDKDHVVTTIEERAFLIEEANRIRPGFKLSESDVLMTWAGIRPLTFDPDQPLGNRARTIHDLSADGLDNLFALTAGPVMSYRSAGRAFVSALSSRIKPERMPAKPDYSPPHFPDNQNSPALLSDNAHIKLSDLQHAARVEHARSLTDVLFRRVGVAWDCALSDVELARAADAVGGVLGWDETRRSEEIANYRADVGSLFQPRPELRPS